MSRRGKPQVNKGQTTHIDKGHPTHANGGQTAHIDEGPPHQCWYGAYFKMYSIILNLQDNAILSAWRSGPIWFFGKFRDWDQDQSAFILELKMTRPDKKNQRPQP